MIDGLVSEQDLSVLEPGQSGVFIADSGEHGALQVTLADIDISAIPFLRYEELASENGGPIASRQADGRLVPESAYYQVEAMPDGNAPHWSSSRQQSGMLIIEGASRSWLAKQFRRIAANLLRETGF